MRKATRVISASFGLFAGFGGVEHGYFEIAQGNTRPQGIMIASIGAPCIPEETWNACEPAMTLIPNFLITGIVALLLGLATMVWAAAFVQRRRGGVVLILLSLALLLFGGGIIPPLIGMMGGLAGTRIHTPLKADAGRLWVILAKLWPWTIVIFFVALFSQFVIGHYFNDVFMQALVPWAITFLGLLLLSILAGLGHDYGQTGRKGM